MSREHRRCVAAEPLASKPTPGAAQCKATALGRIPKQNLELGIPSLDSAPKCAEFSSSTHSAAQTPVQPASHSVQFYDQDSFLVDEVAGFLDVALRAGESAILIATPEHRAALTRQLGGIDAGSAIGSWYPGKLICLDARETLASFMIDNLPDEALFTAALGDVMTRASRHGRGSIRASGEMVTLLYGDGQPEAALRLEALWNGLAQQHQFQLLCAYPMRLFQGAEDVAGFQHLCAAHSHVHAADSAGQASSVFDTRTLAALQQKTLALETEVERRAAAERTLLRREKDLSDFLENAVEGMHRVGGDGTILWANRAEMEMLGYAADEYIGHHISEFYIDASQITDILRRLCAGHTLYDEPAALRCKDGSTRHVLIHSNAFFENGELLYTRCFTREVTERWSRQIVEQERDSLLMQAPVGTALMLGPGHVIRLANARFCSIFGRSDIVDKAYADAFEKTGDSGLLKIMDSVYQTGQPFVAHQYPLCVARPGGGALDDCILRFNLEPLRGAGGEVYGMMAVVIDVTEFVHGRLAVEKTNAERANLLAELESANRAKDEFLAMLGHELRNPLSPIVTALQLMKMRGEVQSTKEQAIIQRQVDHMIRLVDDLLDVSRITRGTVELRQTETEIAPLIAKAIEMASMLFEQRRQHLTIDVPPLGLLWYGDSGRLTQVISNLLTNAARYTAPGGQIKVSVQRDGDHVVISVEDNGQGLSPEVLPHLFDMFYQGKRKVDRAEGGLGIGLSLAKNLVELHGGTISARSEGPGRGSEFKVRLPLPAQGLLTRKALGAEADDAPKAGVSRRVLVVDDNVDAADSLAAVLVGSGHLVEVAYDPIAALQLVETFKPEVAFLDIGLPVMDGYELASRIRQKLPDRSARLFALTGYGLESDQQRSVAAGFDAHLVKPVTMDLVLDLVNRTGEVRS